MNVRKTILHGGVTLAHGVFEAHETVLECAAGCRDPNGRRLTRRQPELAELLLPGGTLGYDVMVNVGISRFVHYQQREAIRDGLERAFGRTLSTGEISLLAKRFLTYLQALHAKRAPKLRHALEQDGGWPMHLDATGEAGRGTMLVVWAGWRHWVLGSWKIASENALAILPRLREIRQLFGSPCGIMRDLGRAVIGACCAFNEEFKPGVRIWSCHFHLVRDVGKDLLTDAYDQLRSLFRQHGVRSRLRAMARDLSRTLGAQLQPSRQQLELWIAAKSKGVHQVPDGLAGIAVGRALTQWVLDYPADGRDEGFPFDLPYLDLFKRCATACRALEAFLRNGPKDVKVHDVLERLHRIVVVTRQPAFTSPVRVLDYRQELLAELRTALRIEAKSQRTCPRPLSPGPASPQALEQEHGVKQALDSLTLSLRERLAECGSGDDSRHALDVVLTHLERHGHSLSGHAIPLPQQLGGGVRLADRTNMSLENFFGLTKRGERRRSGRKNLTADLELLPGAAPLALNLQHPDYVEILCGTLENLPRAFAELDASDRSKSLPARLAKQSTATEFHDARTSLPRADRKLIRSPELLNTIRRAPRMRASSQPLVLPA